MEGPDFPAPPVGYIVSFVPFHERGLGSPGNDFFCALLFHYEVELHHLNPNGLQQIATLVALCKGYMGVLACLKLFRYFFAVQWEKSNGAPTDIGCAGFRLRGNRVDEYLLSRDPATHQG